MSSYKRSIVTIALSRTETMFYSRWPWSGLSRSPKVKLITPSDSRPISYYKCSSVTIALSLTETVFFSKWPWSDLSRSPKIKLIMPSDSRPISYYSYKCSSVTIALSLTETVFFSKWPWSDLSRSPKVKLITPSDSRPISYYKCSSVSIALSLTETSKWPSVFQGHPRSNWLRHPIRDLLMFYSIYSAIPHRNRVFQQMTFIWPFKVNKGQTDYAIQFSDTTRKLLRYYFDSTPILLPY